MAWLAACATWPQVFQAFGQVKEVSMIPNADTGKHKGYGFIDCPDLKSEGYTNDVFLHHAQVQETHGSVRFQSAFAPR